MSPQDLSRETDKLFEEVILIVSSFQDKHINIVPFEDGWTIGQVAEHIHLSASGFTETMNGPVGETHRAPDELKEKLRAVFLDFSTKMKSPEFVVPANKEYDKEELTQVLQDVRNKLNYAIENLDLTKTCLAFELPVFGFLTRLEALYFIQFHTMRHIHQLKKRATILDVPVSYFQ